MTFLARNATSFFVFFEEWKHPPPFPKNGGGPVRVRGGGRVLDRSTPILTTPYIYPLSLSPISLPSSPINIGEIIDYPLIRFILFVYFKDAVVLVIACGYPLGRLAFQK
jgi:hypothetical protein